MNWTSNAPTYAELIASSKRIRRLEELYGRKTMLRIIGQLDRPKVKFGLGGRKRRARRNRRAVRDV